MIQTYSQLAAKTNFEPRCGTIENSLRALAENSSLQPSENRRYSAARQAAVQARRSEILGTNEQVADEADLRSGNPNGSYRKPQVTWENPP